jgi:hypothetical protein
MPIQEHVLNMTVVSGDAPAARTDPPIACSCREECLGRIGAKQCELEKTGGYVMFAKIKGPNGVLTVLDRTKEE